MKTCCEISRIRVATHLLVMVVTAITIVLFTSPVANAQGNGPGFHVSAGGDLNCTANQGVSLPAAPATVGPITFPCTSGQGIAAGQAAANSLRALARAEHVCCGTASGANGRARIQIDNVVITGPAAASIPVSLNFRLSGTLKGSTDFGGHGVFVFMRLAGFNTNLQTDSKIEANHIGILNQSGMFAPLTVGFPLATIDQTFTTPVSNAAPNQPLMFEMQLQAAASMAGLGFTESDFFSGNNGLFLPFGTPVFNLPPGYTINIPELNIVNNFVVLPAVVNGDIYIVGTNASEISLPNVVEVTGNVTITGNASTTTIDLGSLQSVGGSVSIDDNTAASSIDLASLETLGGSVSIEGNTAASSIDLASLETLGGSVSIDDNTAASSIDLASLETLGGTVSIADNTAASSINLGSLTTANAVDVSGNTSATGIDLASLTTVNGNVNVSQNGPCTSVILGSLTTVTGNLTINSCGTGTFTPGPAAAGGNTILTTAGYTSVTGSTAAGTTTLSNTTGAAAMTVRLPAGSFTTPVSFLLTHLDPAMLAPETGFDANNTPATIDPVAAYQITFGVPTLNQNATLSFDVFLSSLDNTTAAALLAALSNGTATLATRGDAQGSQYQAFPICGPGQEPTAGGCVLVQLLDANGQPTTGTPAIVRFSNVVGHFSTWAVAIVTPQSSPSHVFNGLLSPYPEAPHTTTPAFKRGRVIPLKFNWVNSAGIVVDSANANPSVTFSSANCTTQAPLADAITPEDAGNSGGLHYDASTMTWTFNWSTKSLSTGCYVVRVTAGSNTFAAPGGPFPVALRNY